MQGSEGIVTSELGLGPYLRDKREFLVPFLMRGHKWKTVSVIQEVSSRHHVYQQLNLRTLHPSEL